MKRNTILKTALNLALVLILSLMTATSSVAQQAAHAGVVAPPDRTQLPVQEPKRPVYKELEVDV